VGSLANDYPLFAFSGTLWRCVMGSNLAQVKKTCAQRRAVTGCAGLCPSRPGRLGGVLPQRQITSVVVAPWSFWYKAALFSRGPVPSL